MSKTMANINYKENFKSSPPVDGMSTPDSLSDQENSRNPSSSSKDKRLSIAEELDATKDELQEAQDRVAQVVTQVNSRFSGATHIYQLISDAYWH